LPKNINLKKRSEDDEGSIKIENDDEDDNKLEI